MDRRIIKTRHMLQAALLALLRELPFEDIEIQTITERANTARVTFYRHYGKKEELLADTLENIYQELQSELTHISVDSLFDLELTPPIQIVFRFVDRDRLLYKNLLMGTMSAFIQQRVRHYLVQQVIITFSQTPRYADLPIILIANNLASQAIGNIMWWLSEDLPYSAEYMARITHVMAFFGALSLMGRSADIRPLPPEVWRLPSDHG
ncbi:MAG: TetR/AcrR family transcriptional regulator [Anaerolineae bacterium]|nr:TetR/AcrR family transcriptional regulator [Anaerolineae bacterium]